MVRGILKTIIVLLVASSFHSVTYAQIMNDVEGTILLLKLLPLEQQPIATLKNKLKKEWSIEDEDLGFGARRIIFEKGIYYTSIYIEALTFNNKLIFYETGVRSYSEEWPRMKTFVLETWKENNGPLLIEDEHRVFYRKTFDKNQTRLKSAIAQLLGKSRIVDIPENLRQSYEYLLNPINNIAVSENYCGLPPSILPGKNAIDTLASVERHDLIENVLRSYNPGARLYAAAALLAAKKRGVRLSNTTNVAIKKIINMQTPISTCSGCIFFTEKGKNIIRKLQQN